MFLRRRFRSPQARKTRRQRLVWFILLYLAIFLGIVLLLVQISRLPQMRIDNVSIVGTKATDKVELYSSAVEKLSGKYFYLFPHNNIFLYPREAIESALLKEFPRLKSVDAGIVGRNQIEITVTERDAVGVVCSNVSIGQECYFLDDRGFVFAQAPVFSGRGYFVYREDSSRRFKIGSYFLNPTTFTNIQDLKEILERLGLSVESALASGKNTEVFARHITMTLEEGTDIIFSSDVEDSQNELQNLEAILVSSEFEEESAGDIGTIEYIDLRFGNKVYYRLERGGNEN